MHELRPSVCAKMARAMRDPNVKSVFVIPIHEYDDEASGRRDPCSGRLVHGHMCVVLGKEKFGPRAGQFSFIGGKRQGKSVLATLFRETREELTKELDVERFLRNLLDVYVDGCNVFFVVAWPGISCSDWTFNQAKRDPRAYGPEYFEISEIGQFVVGTRRESPASKFGPATIQHDYTFKCCRFVCSDFVVGQIYGAIRAAYDAYNLATRQA